MEIIFVVNTTSYQIVHSNKAFKNLFLMDKESCLDFNNNSNLKRLIEDGLKSLAYSELGRTFFTYNEDKYIFDIDKTSDDCFIFSGHTLDDDNINLAITSNKLLRNLADNLPDMLWAKDVNGKYIFANKAICDKLLMAKDTNEPIGTGDVFFALREREKHSENKEWHTFGELCFNSDEVVLEHMKNMVFKEFGNVKGKPLFLEVHKAPFFDEDGRLLGTVGSGRDITQEILAKRELQLKDELIYQQSKMASMGEMLENIVHQWKQPLNLISVLNSTTRAKLELDIPVDTYQLTKDFEKYIIHLTHTVDDFRNFFKEDKLTSHFNPSDIMIKTIDLLVFKFKKLSIEFIYNLEDFEIEGYPRELMQVFMNILTNATDAFEEKIDSTSKRLLFIKIKKNDSKTIIKIKDTAGGIPDDVIEYIFESKFTTKGEAHGTGIGLYMSKEIISKHMKGSIEVKNQTFIYDNISYCSAEFTIII